MANKDGGIKHIYWFAHYNLDGPCVRYRGLYALKHMQDAYGISYSFVVPGYSPPKLFHFFLMYLEVLFLTRKNSLIIFQKIYTRGFYAVALKLLLRAKKGKVLYDIDDAYYELFPPETIHHFLEKCSVVCTGSKELDEYARQYAKNVYKNTSPVIEHGIHKKVRNTTFTIGWVGFYTTHKSSLEQLVFPALDNLNFNVKLVLLGVVRPEHLQEVKDRFANSKHIELEMPTDLDWQNENSIYRRISEFDIGVSPLLDTSLNRAKSAFKLKQYLSCGVPTLASPVGENPFFIQEGVNGFNCSSSTEFSEKMKVVRNWSDEEYANANAAALASAQNFTIAGYSDRLLEIAQKML